MTNFAFEERAYHGLGYYGGFHHPYGYGLPLGYHPYYGHPWHHYYGYPWHHHYGDPY